VFPVHLAVAVGVSLLIAACWFFAIRYHAVGRLIRSDVGSRLEAPDGRAAAGGAGHVRVGRHAYMKNRPGRRTTPTRCTSCKQWMWKVQHTRRAARDHSLYVRPPAGEADHEQRGRDPQLYVRSSLKQDVIPGRYNHALVRADAARHVPPVCPRYCGGHSDGRQGRGDGPEAFAAGSRARVGRAGPRRGEAVPAVSVRALPHRRGGGAGPSLEGVFAAPAAGGTLDRVVDEGIWRESILKRRRRWRPVTTDHADVQAGDRGRAGAADRVHQGAAAARRRRRSTSPPAAAKPNSEPPGFSPLSRLAGEGPG